MSNCPNKPSSPTASDKSLGHHAERKTLTPTPEQSDDSYYTDAQRPEYNSERYELVASHPSSLFVDPLSTLLASYNGRPPLPLLCTAVSGRSHWEGSMRGL